MGSSQSTNSTPSGLSPHDEKMARVHATLLRVKQQVRTPPDTNIRYEGVLRLKRSGRLLDPNKPPSRPFTCKMGKDDCEICFLQFFPATHGVTNEEAQEIVNSLVDGINDDLEYLRKAIKHRGDQISTKWQKKTRVRRHKLLMDTTDIYPKKLAAVHLLQQAVVQNGSIGGLVSRSVLDKCSSSAESQANLGWKNTMSSYVHDSFASFTETTTYQDTWILPYLDAETLSEDPLRLLGLLYHRTINDPDSWLMFDNSQLVMAEHLMVIPPLFNENCVTMYGANFGKLVKWNAEQAHRWEIVGYNKAHCLLTAQRRMFFFLRNVVQALIPQEFEIPNFSPQLKWDRLVLEKLSASATDFAWSTDSVRPFSAPPTFNPHKILESVAARYRASKDEMDLIQTDPSYVQYLVSQYLSTVFIEKYGVEQRWAYFVDELIFVPLRREMYWRQLLAECELMVKAFDTLQKKPLDSTREEYDAMLYMVEDMAVEFFAVMVTLLDYSLPQQRGLERNFQYRDGTDSGVDAGGKVRHKLQVIEKDSFPDDILFWSLSTLHHKGNSANCIISVD